MKKIQELRDHVFRPLIYLIFLAVVVLALFIGGNRLITNDARAAAFADVPESSWAFDAVRHLAATGCMTGYEKDGEQVFEPARPMTRAEVAQVIFCLDQ